MKKPTEQSLTKLADAAFRQAALTVIKCAEESGTPIYYRLEKWLRGEIGTAQDAITR